MLEPILFPSWELTSLKYWNPWYKQQKLELQKCIKSKVSTYLLTSVWVLDYFPKDFTNLHGSTNIILYFVKSFGFLKWIQLTGNLQFKLTFWIGNNWKVFSFFYHRFMLNRFFWHGSLRPNNSDLDIKRRLKSKLGTPVTHPGAIFDTG